MRGFGKKLLEMTQTYFFQVTFPFKNSPLLQYPPGGGFGILLIERIMVLLAPAWQGRGTLGRGVLTRMERTV